MESYGRRSVMTTMAIIRKIMMKNCEERSERQFSISRSAETVGHSNLKVLNANQETKQIK